MREVFRLASANIKITPADGTDPVSVVSFAERELAKHGYDRVYCVFDRDTHANYAQALQRIAQFPGGKIYAAPSTPCFEIWILLHFAYSTAPFVAAGKRSAGDEAVREVIRHLPKYTKGYSGVFDELEQRLDQALKHAEQLKTHNQRTGSSNPATEIHTLVEFLKTLMPS